MKEEKLYLVGTHRGSFRPGEPAEIIGTVMVETANDGLRPCFKVRFNDGQEDTTTIFAIPGNSQLINPHYKLISEADVRAGRIPTVVH